MNIKGLDMSHFNMQVMDENENKANMFSSVALLIAACVLGAAWFLNALDVFAVDKKLMRIVFFSLLPTTVSPFILTKFFKCEKKWLKYYIMFCAVILAGYLDAVLTYNITLIMILPVLLSCHYYSVRLSINTAAITIVVFAISTVIGVYYGMIDLNITSIPDTTVIVVEGSLDAAVMLSGTKDYWGSVGKAFQFSYLPRLFAFMAIAPICYMLSDRTRALVQKLVETTRERERIAAELDVAAHIQESMLPLMLSTFPGRDEFDVSALMDPAKEVGGDFYDCFFVDDDHFAFVIADVSGKGVPAALFMVVSKTLVKNQLQAGLSPADALTRANKQLCEGNEENMFVTAWVGLYEISTGKLTYVNAGHNPPLVRKSGGFEYLRDEPQPLLAIMDFAAYRHSETHLGPGDGIFLYTDGVTEAANPEGDMYGEARLLAALNQDCNANAAELSKMVVADVEAFVAGDDQFDDITIFVLTVNGDTKRH